MFIYNIPEERLELERKRKSICEYYGIPYDVIDDSVATNSQVEKDRNTAWLLILEGKTIPADLETRLLRYKEGHNE